MDLTRVPSIPHVLLAGSGTLPFHNFNNSAVRVRDAGSLMLAKCDGRDSQSWTLTGNPRVVTNVKSKADGGCWEIDGCGGTGVDTDYGCKALPKGPLPCSGCCNMAWQGFNAAVGFSPRAIVSVLPPERALWLG